jgi:hypothetical protein
MDVFLIPTRTSMRYELYYEAPDDEIVEASEGDGLGQRLKRRFAEMLKEAQEWRHRRQEHEAASRGLLVRVRRRVMGFIVERIAEQRLLWHLRRATEVCARIPSDLPEAEADRIIRAMLKKDADHHLKWLLIDLALMLLCTPLIFIPGPNVPGFYFLFQVFGHFFSMRGARQGLSGARWIYKPSADLVELREAMHMAPPQRQRRFRELANRLRLEHLASFCERVAAPTA